MLRLLMFLFCLIPVFVQGQPLAVLLKNAEQAAEAGRPLEAAEAWERAARLKVSEAKYFYQAAESYAQARDYVRAADCYRLASDDPRFPLAKLRQARALKQQGRHAEAAAVLEDFAGKYQGEHRAVVVSVAENEWLGCALALAGGSADGTSARRLGDSLNTEENEFAPLLFSENLLYFSRSAAPKAHLLRSVKAAGQWGAAKEAVLPPLVANVFRSGCFSLDGTRFYYAACAEGCPARMGSSAKGAGCSLYVVERGEGGWAAPQRLPDYLNWPGSSAAFPHVAEWDGKEHLFFSSDKPGGFGGFDLYVCEREVGSGALDFSFPQNLGMKINTGADDICPHYDAENAVLWFSSMGHPSLGGLDVFFSEKEGGVWAKPQNPGAPINSPADDSFFTLKKNGRGAFLCSNRAVEMEKTGTLDDDIFELEWRN